MATIADRLRKNWWLLCSFPFQHNPQCQAPHASLLITGACCCRALLIMFSSPASILIRKVPSARFLYCKQMISDLTSGDESQIFFRQQGSSVPCLFDITEAFFLRHFCMLTGLMWKGLVKIYRNISFFRISLRLVMGVLGPYGKWKWCSTLEKCSELFGQKCCS